MAEEPTWELKITGPTEQPSLEMVGEFPDYYTMRGILDYIKQEELHLAYEGT